MNASINQQVSDPDRLKGRRIAVAGVVLLFAPILGFILTVAWLSHEFDELARSASPGDPSSASRHAGGVIMPAIVSYIPSALGLVLIGIAIRRYRFTPRWLWRALIGASLLWLLAFPLGTLVAFAGLVALYRKRSLFAPGKNDLASADPR